jgi:acyl carrier protein
MNYEPAIKNFIVENYLFGDGQNLQNNTSFLESGIIDSTGILELITFLEENYNIRIEDDELIPENLDSINNVSRFLQNKMNGSAVQSA